MTDSEVEQMLNEPWTSNTLVWTLAALFIFWILTLIKAKMERNRKHSPISNPEFYNVSNHINYRRTDSDIWLSFPSPAGRDDAASCAYCAEKIFRTENESHADFLARANTFLKEHDKVCEMQNFPDLMKK